MQQQRMATIWVVALLMIGLMVGAAYAHGGITVDGDGSDWANLGNGNCPVAPGVNSGVVLTVTDSDCGLADAGTEYVWTDAVGDERTDFSTPDTRVDITELRINGDENNLYFLIRMNNIDQGTGNGAPQVQIAIDTDKIAGSGTEWLGGNSDTQVDNSARWEHLVLTRFGSSNANVMIWDSGFANQRFVGAEANSTINNVVEISIPWTELGALTPGGTAHFTVAAFRSNTSDDTWDIGGNSDALDAITTTGPNTWDEVSDQVVNYSIDLSFQDPSAISLQALSAGSQGQLQFLMIVALLGVMVTVSWLMWQRRVA